MEVKVTFTVNGKERTVTTDPQRPLLDVLREDLGLTGTKYGCGEGMCGACTVIMEGEAIRSCITPISEAAKKKIITIEGLAQGEVLHPVQQAFMDVGRIQCGYCLSGMMMRATALLEKTPHPSDTEILDGMDGNICRCCGYAATLKAIHRAAGKKE